MSFAVDSNSPCVNCKLKDRISICILNGGPCSHPKTAKAGLANARLLSGRTMDRQGVRLDRGLRFENDKELA